MLPWVLSSCKLFISLHFFYFLNFTMISLQLQGMYGVRHMSMSYVRHRHDTKIWLHSLTSIFLNCSWSLHVSVVHVRVIVNCRNWYKLWRFWKYYIYNWIFFFRVPIIGGKELDLCRLFIEVTSRGGIEKVRCQLFFFSRSTFLQSSWKIEVEMLILKFQRSCPSLSTQICWRKSVPSQKL